MEKDNRLVEACKNMVAIDSESGNEERFHEYLIHEFRRLGLDCYEDNSQVKTKLGGNNLVFKLRGTLENTQTVFFSTYTDTVKPGIGIEVIEKDGHLYSKGDTILGADNKAGIAILLEAVKRMKETNMETGLVEFVFSPGEEIGLIGSASLEFSLLEAERVTTASPYLYMYDVTIKGKAAHSGLEPEKGISVISVLSSP